MICLKDGVRVRLERVDAYARKARRAKVWTYIAIAISFCIGYYLISEWVL